MSPKRATPPQDDPLLDRCGEFLLDPPGPDALLSEYAILADGYRTLSRRLYKTLLISDGYQQQVKELAVKLERAMTKINQLREVALPLCVYCRRVRPQSEEYWQKLETFLSRNADIMFSQGICPDCLKATYARMGATEATQQQPAKAPQEPKKRNRPSIVTDDQYVREAKELAARVEAKAPEFEEDLERLVLRYSKLARRFAKTVTISDSYQSQLRDLNMRLELLARTDLLTGLANRWEMTHRLEAEHNRMQRHSSELTLILGDVDHFKQVNDTYGHQCGDAVLRNVATLMQTHLRAEDLCARWGGEEFMILLPETGVEAASNVAKKLGELVRDTPTRWNGSSITVTMSFGIASVHPGSDLDKAISTADDALYEAKAQGRDRAVTASTLPQP
ncbi:diguanylate cyclase domain-containing protein [Fundidesulfovibrio soli]|uniref:diguanylate cyclase domain-containing protein n=1 Tax=Fundidesulfovibrio soli TaxID=2922716 RepID=UPI001FAF070B|nr:diguanylate cyclase [Fundidesulfovibrio soli]